VDDLAGNVWEITTSSLDRDQLVVRGSSFFQDRGVLLSTHREPVTEGLRDHTVGVRVCADVVE
jgi:formylglycine-generating enzyme required for sulfatase activity